MKSGLGGLNSYTLKINMEPKNGDWEDDVHVLSNWVIFGFQLFIFRGVEMY